MPSAAEIRRQMEARMAAEAAADAAAKAKATPAPKAAPPKDSGLVSSFRALVERRTNDVEETADGKKSTRKYR
jgi:hypothetical protein